MSSDDSPSAEEAFGLGGTDADASLIDAYKSLGMVDHADDIVSDEVTDGFRRVGRADGTIERHYADSIWIIALDGTTTTWRPDGTATVFHADGARTEVDRGGTRHTVRTDGTPVSEATRVTTDPDGAIRSELADGAVALAEIDGTQTLVLPDGTRSATRPDGTVVRISERSTWETGVDGTTSITRSDGSVSTIHPDGSRTDVSPDGDVVEIDSGERRALSDDVVVEEPPERAAWMRFAVPAGLVVAVVVVAVALLNRSDPEPDTSFVVPDATEAMRAAPEGFDLQAWCGTVVDAFDAQVALDLALATDAADQAESAVGERIATIEVAATGAPPDLGSVWEQAVFGATSDGTALERAGYQYDRYLRAQPADVDVPALALDRFLVEQVDACMAASLEP